jgi:hypothetical protein
MVSENGILKFPPGSRQGQKSYEVSEEKINFSEYFVYTSDGNFVNYLLRHGLDSMDSKVSLAQCRIELVLGRRLS